MKTSEVKVGMRVRTRIGEELAEVEVIAPYPQGPRRRWHVARPGGSVLPKPRSAAALRAIEVA